jgi:acyl-CoA hydrolase
VAAEIRRFLRPGCRVAVADGAGAPVSALPLLADAAEEIGGVSLVLGWLLDLDPGLLRASAFPDIRALMSGYALRRPIREGNVIYVPARLGSSPALLSGPLRPDVLIASVRPHRGGFAWCSEVSWMACAAQVATTVLGVVNGRLPITSGEPELPADRVTVVAEVADPPPQVRQPNPDDSARAIGEAVASLIPAGAAVQLGPGRIATAVLEALKSPVRICSGVIDDMIVDLDERGLLAGQAETAYVVGSDRLYDWANGRPISRRIEYTHDVRRLSAMPFFAINTALEIDTYGQVNTERIGDDPIGGIGGHGDFALAASRSRDGLSIIALPRQRAGQSTLLDRLEVPASTAFPDIDMVVCEAGLVDLRATSSAERRAALTDLWSR